ncbi:MAG: hypothetical protein QXU08_08130, partial [Ignisphaera sp.]
MSHRERLRSSVAVFGLSGEPLVGVGIRSTTVGDVYVVTDERYQTLRSLRILAAAMRKLSSLPLDWICVQGRLSMLPLWLAVSTPVKEFPKQITIGLLVERVCRIDNTFVVLDRRNIFRLCVQKPEDGRVLKYS